MPFARASVGSFWPDSSHRDMGQIIAEEKHHPWRVERPGYSEQRVGTRDEAARLIDASGGRIGLAVNTLTGEVLARSKGEWTERPKAKPHQPSPEPSPAAPARDRYWLD